MAIGLNQTRRPRLLTGSEQGLMPARYRLTVKIFSLAAFTLAFVGWLNETWLMLFDNPIWLNRYTEYAIILGFGLWRIWAEKNSYTRKRLIILVSMVTVVWWFIPWIYPLYEPYVGFVWAQPVFPSLHVPGTITFFLILLLVFLFGRRVVCGFNCPCVGIRETVGFAFREGTLRSDWSWALRHSKWVFFIYYVVVMVVTQFPPNNWTLSFVGGFYLIVAGTYFGSFFIAPLVGNRFYCRYLCPFGATFGLLNHAGFYGIKMDTKKCIDCQRCEQVCDMGIPVWKQGSSSGRVTALEDCMGCARCVVSCPTDALEIKDVRNLFNKSLVQNASYLDKRVKHPPVERSDADYRPAVIRNKDWGEISLAPGLARIQAQASRCLDCGLPGCGNACPLHNRIPEWLELVAAGKLQQAAVIAHSTSNMPEICGTLCPQQRLCEGACTMAKQTEGAVTIGQIERYLADSALANGWPPKITPLRNNWRVAIVGAGPAGLACADELNKAGCRVKIYEREPIVGGLMATAIPPFKLDKAMLKRRHLLLQQQGVVFELGINVDKAMLTQLIEQYDAIFIGSGAHKPRKLSLDGQQLNGVSEALSYLAGVNRQQDALAMLGKRVIVLGGGDSAMDCARSAIRQGATKVTVAYRGCEQIMRASPKERQAARDEGVGFLFDHQALEIQGKTAVEGFHFKHHEQRLLIPCDAVIVAIGQVNKVESWMEPLGIQTDKRGRIVVDEQGRTSHHKIYAGGDNTHGPDLVVTALAAGRKAASGILNSFSFKQRLLQPIRANTKKRQDLSVSSVEVLCE